MRVEVVRKPIENLHLAVYPPDGRVRLAVPEQTDPDAVRLAVVSRLAWIRKRRETFARQRRQSQREMVTGESHYFMGRRYRLNVIIHSGHNDVRLRGGSILDLMVRPTADAERRRVILHEWYRAQLKERIPALIEKWEPVVGVPVREWRVKRMRTRWGTCNREARRIWLNLELAKKPPECLEYIVVHEMVHFLERHHSDRFRALMDSFMPRWRLHRSTLDRAPLAHEDWAY